MEMFVCVCTCVHACIHVCVCTCVCVWCVYVKGGTFLPWKVSSPFEGRGVTWLDRVCQYKLPTAK